MSGIYVYAIVPPTVPPELGVAGLSPDGSSVRTLRGQGLAAIIGASPPVDFRSLSRQDAVRFLLAHQRVVEAIMRVAPALPVKFGTVLPHEEAVANLLALGADVLVPRLAEFAERIQVELIVSWNLEQVLAEIAKEDEVVALKTKIAAEPGAATSEARITLGRLVKAAIDRRRDAVRTRVFDALRPLAIDLVENALIDDRMIVNVALLLPSGSGDALDERLAQLDKEFDERLNFRCIGPLPPSSFATVEIDLPSFAAIDRARRALRLGASARLAEIKSAYHRLIRQSHPDRAAAARTDAPQAAELTSAYRTLLLYAGALPLAGGNGAPAGSGYRFDRGAVEGAILVAVRRQELGAALEGQP